MLVKLLLDVTMNVLYLLLMFAKELGEFFHEVVGIGIGVLIARELFTIDTGLPWMMLFSLHNTLSYVCLGAMALHLLLHSGYLAEFLSGLPCSGCGKHCPLSHPRCARGEMQAQRATEEYYQTCGE